MEAHKSRRLCFSMGWLEGGGAEKLRCEYSVAVRTGGLPLKLCGSSLEVRNRLLPMKIKIKRKEKVWEEKGNFQNFSCLPP